MWIRALTTK